MANEQYIWNYLKSQGLNDYGVAGTMGNLACESGLDPKNLQNTGNKALGMTDDEYVAAVDNGTYTRAQFIGDKFGFGLAQWTAQSRAANLYDFAKSEGTSIGDLDMQLDFLMKELRESYSSVLATLKTATSVLEASNAVLLNFEKPADQSESVQAKRANYAQTYYDKHHNTGGDSMSINIAKKTSTNNTTQKTGRTISYIVIHYTAGVTSKAGSAANTASYFSTTTTQASADFIVDDETIVQYNPDLENRYCWHCGGGARGQYYGICTNANSIGIEVCSTNSTGKVTNANDKYWSFTDAAVAKATELAKYLMERFHIDADHVITHYLVNQKCCPGIIGWNDASGDTSKWLAFKAGLTNNATTTTEEDEDMTTEKFKEMMDEYLTNLQAEAGSTWSEDDRNWAVEKGLIQGSGTNADGSTKYMWKSSLTREQFCSVARRLAKLVGVE